MPSSSKVGVYVDVANMYHNGGDNMRYDVLREFACRDGADPVRLNAYVSYDKERADKDQGYKSGSGRFHTALRDFGYKVIVKTVKWYQDESGRRVGKANADLDLAVDALLQSDNLDRVLLVTGDGDFVQVVRALQNKGCRVEVVSLHGASADLRREADLFVPGFLIPGLIPMNTDKSKIKWGELGSRVRGSCVFYDSEKSFGFMRYHKKIAGGLWITDARSPDSPYGSSFFHEGDLADKSLLRGMLPSSNLVFEFDLEEDHKDKEKSRARRIELLCKLPSAD